MQGRELTHRHASIALAFVMITMCGTVSRADPLETALNDWNPVSLTGQIADVGRDYITVGERMIYLVDTLYSGKQYTTEIEGSDCRPCSRNVLTRGAYVFVAGSYSSHKANNKVIIARKVYVQETKIPDWKVKELTSSVPSDW